MSGIANLPQALSNDLEGVFYAAAAIHPTDGDHYEVEPQYSAAASQFVILSGQVYDTLTQNFNSNAEPTNTNDAKVELAQKDAVVDTSNTPSFLPSPGTA